MRSITSDIDLVRNRSRDAGSRFVVVGDGRLVAAVTALLEQREAVVEHVPARDLKAALEQPATCVLALDRNHETNLQAAFVVAEVNAMSEREIPVVVRAFDPALADEIERARPGVPFRVRGAFSVAHLAAPDYVVSALVDDGEHSLVTLRLGDEYMNVCRLRVVGAEESRRGRRLVGRTPAKLAEERGCHVLARRDLPSGDWQPPGEDPLDADEEILVGGQLLDVLGLVRREGAGGPSAPPPRPARRSGGRLDRARAALRRAGTHIGTRTTWFLIALFVLVTVAVASPTVDSPSNRVYLWVLTALGSPPPSELQVDSSPLVSALGLLAGGLALGLGISLMSAYFMHLRAEDTTIRRARRLHHHVVVFGLGDVGLRIVQLLDRLGVPCAVVDTATDPESVRRRSQVGLVPVVPADLESGMPDASIGRASSLIATSHDNLLNVEACLRAKRATQEHARTIARIFDDIPGVGAMVFGIDDQISAAAVAAPTFVDAALHEEGVRTIDFPGWPMLALRWPAGNPVGSRQVRRWHRDGVRLLAVWQDGVAVRPDCETPRIDEAQAATLVGPRAAMEHVLDELRGRTPPRLLKAAA